jgi:hypothetical protein
MSYTIEIDGQSKSYARLNDATKFADKKALESGIEVKVLHTETEAVAYATSPRAITNREDGTHFVPWTRVETPKHLAPEIEGFIPAYTRKRIQATVYRGQERGQWIVFDGRTGQRRLVANTTESRLLLTEMKNGLQL